MAGKRIEMKDVRSIVLMLDQGYGTKHISKTLGCSRNTVKAYRDAFAAKGLSYKDLLELPEEQLEKFFSSGPPEDDPRLGPLMKVFEGMDKELERVGVTRFLLWTEYARTATDPYSYAQFCKLYRDFTYKCDATMHIEHDPGDKLYVDFTGKKFPYVDKETGEELGAEVFIASMGYSDMTYLEACKSQTVEDFIMCVRHALEFFGGSPKILVPDNLKSAVETPDKYEAELNSTMAKLARHYGTTVIPARVKHPKDKPIVERHVTIAYQQVFAVLRNVTLFSIREINEAIRPHLKAMNTRKFQGKPFSRADLFEEERSLLTALPAHPFEFDKQKWARVMKNCYVQLMEDCHYYSVPYRYIGSRVQIIYNSYEVSIWFKGERIAYHLRDYRKFKYTTISDHLPSTHQFVLSWSPEKFIGMAAQVSPFVQEYIERILSRSEPPEQLYKSCMGILALGKRLGNDRLIKACRLGMQVGAINYTFIKKTLANKTENLFEEQSVQMRRLPQHENIRGMEIFNTLNDTQSYEPRNTQQVGADASAWDGSGIEGSGDQSGQ